MAKGGEVPAYSQGGLEECLRLGAEWLRPAAPKPIREAYANQHSLAVGGVCGESVLI